MGSGFWVLSLGFRTKDLEFRVMYLGLGGLTFRKKGFGLGLGVWGWGLGFRV